VVVISYIFFMRRVLVATWVPFFDNGKCIGQVVIHVVSRSVLTRLGSGRYHFSSAHFGV
jgi:hypothetical protein